MKTLLILTTCLFLSIGIAACKKAEQKGTQEPTSALESTSTSTITGDQLTVDYVKILCGKYKQCGIKAFSDDTDCHNRIQAALKQDAKWKELHMNKKALKTCLKDFKDFSCENFTGGNSPESCRKL